MRCPSEVDQLPGVSEAGSWDQHQQTSKQQQKTDIHPWGLIDGVLRSIT